MRGAAHDDGALLLYANDAEVFDHRPGRFAAEPAAQEGEWDRIAEALAAVAAAGTPALPSEVLALGPGRELRLEAPAHPIPVKKQDKYNVARWAVSGRDDVGINTRCQRLYERLRQVAEPEPWRRLCALWASDFRTHIGTERWEAMQAELAEAERRHAVTAPAPPPPRPAGAEPPAQVTRDGRLWRIAAGDLEVVLNERRGLAVDSFRDGRLGGDVAARDDRARLLPDDRARRRLVHGEPGAGVAAAPEGHRPGADRSPCSRRCRTAACAPGGPSRPTSARSRRSSPSIRRAGGS